MYTQETSVIIPKVLIVCKNLITPGLSELCQKYQVCIRSDADLGCIILILHADTGYWGSDKKLHNIWSIITPIKNHVEIMLYFRMIWNDSL